MSRTLEWIVGPDDVGERADVVLGRRLPGVSRRVARTLAHGGALRIDDVLASPSSRLVLGQRMVLVLAPDTTDEPHPLHVLACTDDFVYVDKPAGVHTHRLQPGGPAALADAVARRFPECADASDDPREGGAIHRLDRMTTGVTAFARNADAWRRGRAAMTVAHTRKIYVALTCTSGALRWPPRDDVHAVARNEPWWRVDGLPVPQSVSPVRLELPLGHGPDRGTVAVRPDGRPTRCDVVPLAVAPGAVDPDGTSRCLVAVSLGRGHRHQIRVHLAWLGMPIEGDTRYGGSPNTSSYAVADAFALHCMSLDISRACPGEPTVVAPLPAAFAERLVALQLQPWAADAGPW